MEERRIEMSHLMDAMEAQNDLLAKQNALLLQLVAFITPISAFFAAFKNFVIFMAWVVGTLTACFAAWHSFVAWVKLH